ncbi:CHAP domain-containing protein [Streptosporangium sp. NPDC006007]|uniref:CHAP domain-containing protein n=1 Tax=Streptosporangium sp. NPDC006007 TaxID=3154575 RepID=UPI0033A901F3
MSPEMQKFIELLESQLGYSEKSGGYTKFGDWYGSDVEFDADYSAAPWCDMYLSWAAKKLGYEDWLGQFAYTVYHARWFQQQGAWGTTPKPGAIVFFDWGGSRQLKKIDHIGVVTRVEGRTIHTIEGNIDGGVAKRKKRDTAKVVGYGYPEKIKARLEKEAAQQREIITADAPVDSPMTLGLGPSLLSMVSAPVRETVLPASPVQAKAAARHAKPAVDSPVTPSTPDRAPSEARKNSRTGQKNAPKTAKTPAPSQSSAGRTGKHSKPATADTSAIAVPAPVAVRHDLPLDISQLATPAILAPVLLAAAAIIAHAKVRQSRTRPAFAGQGRAVTRPPRRTPGRRRIVKNVPVLAEGRRSSPRAVSETTLPPATTTGFPSVTSPLSHVEESRQNGLVHAGHPVPYGEQTTPRGRRHAGRPVPGDRRHDGSRLPYQGRRRLHERPVVESSTFVQDAPLRGRRHRRAEPVVSTTMPSTPAVPASRSTPAALTVPATPAVPLASPTGEYGDVLVHSGYRGRRRAGVPA